ncbi:MAG: class I SAM-dependent methyltransferase [Alphaproteobacteria bacterium]|nr:class I SAM-dependent methyltransferase [Alphaproteobacteria bacterium]
MSLVESAVHRLEGAPLPDFVTRAGIELLVSRTQRRLAAQPAGFEAEFARAMAGRPIAENTAEANAQHYELPPQFFGLILGPRRKYSCCLYAPGDDLATAEARSLEKTCRHAGLHDGQTVLELGCGWGSLSLWMAEHYPRSRIVAVSNSHAQRRFIQQAARERGLRNLEVVTADMNSFTPDRRFDRIVSVEMFEHMANWGALLARVRDWLAPEGRLFVHVFTHARTPYRFNVADPGDWIARHFFAGGVMPSHGLMGRFGDLFELERDWRWDGRQYQTTALDWLANFDRARDEITEILRPVYGQETGLWLRRWRLFFLATAGLFGHDRGKVWGVSHYRLKPRVQETVR